MNKKNSKFFYAIGAMGKDLYSAFMGSFLTIYLTDVFGLSGIAMGTLFLVARIWDAVNDPLMFLGMVIMFAGIGIILVTSTAQMADTVDYSEWTLGKRSEGVIFSMNSFAIKFGQAVGGSIIGYGLTAIGYEANQPQTARTLMGIRILIAVVPLLLALVSLGVYWRYELDSHTLKQMEAELRQRQDS